MRGQDFERILKTHHASLMGDPFIKLYMDDILRTMRTQVLLKAIAPYTRVTLPYVASELNGIPVADVEDLLVSLILDGKVEGKIDQVPTRGEGEGGCFRSEAKEFIGNRGCTMEGVKLKYLPYGVEQLRVII